jgi:hypothetical protein
VEKMIKKEPLPCLTDGTPGEAAVARLAATTDKLSDIVSELQCKAGSFLLPARPVEAAAMAGQIPRAQFWQVLDAQLDRLHDQLVRLKEPQTVSTCRDSADRVARAGSSPASAANERSP